MLFLYNDLPGEFTVSNKVPISLKARGVYFFKCAAVQVTIEEIDKLILLNDIHTSPLEQLNTLSQEVFFPLIANTENQEGWPEVISKEITDNFHRFLANSYITIGRSIGKTLLPLPPPETISSSPGGKGHATPKDKDSVHVLENAVVTWTRQIKNVLKQEPEGLLKGDQNPGPGAELEFWKNKAANLNSIHEQLIGEKIRKVMSVLEATKSTYYPAFDRLCKEVSHSRAESNDNLIYLQPADKYFSQLLSCPFDQLKGVFNSIMHVTLLIWEHSQFYNTPARLVVLIREFCNDIIRQACRYMGDLGITDSDPKEAVSKLKIIIGVCLGFKESYFLFKRRSTTEVPDNPWRFQSSALFTRLDSFLERCHDVLDLMQTLTQFLSLNKIEIGGTKGKTLTSSVQQIFLDFQQSIVVFQSDYDVMNVDSKVFEEHFYDFRLELSELERRVASVIVQAFEDSSTILGKFKLLDSFEGLLERDILHSELEKKHNDLLNDYLFDLSQVQEIFLMGKPLPNVNDNAPPHAGAVAWVRGLLQRVEDPMKRLLTMGKMILDTESGRECEEAFKIVVKMLKEFENDHIQQWARDVANTSEAKLKLSLLRRDESSSLPILHVNFDPALVCLLREVKYFLSLGVTVPEAALAIYRNEETFRVQTGNLDLIVNLYNHILKTLLDVERPLVQQKMSNIDKVLQKGLKHMNWKSHTIGDFITQCMTIVKEVHTIVAAIKRDVADTQRILESWSLQPLMYRKQIRTYLPEEFTELQRTLIAERFADIKQGGEQIHKNLTVSQKILRANRGSVHFKAYIDYVNEVVIAGLADAAFASCNYLLQQVDPVYLAANDINPLLEIQMKLSPPDVVFSPPLGRNDKRQGVGDLVLGWVAMFCNIGMLMRRIDTPNGDGDYLLDVQADLDVKHTISKIKVLMTENEHQCEIFRRSFLDYEYLWTTDIAESFQTFLRAEGRHGLPHLMLFEQRIQTYRELEDEIREIPGSKVIGWLKVDVRPLRNSLLTQVTKWRDVYQQYLLDYVAISSQELLTYIDSKLASLNTMVVDVASLELVLGHLRDIRKREDSTDASFDPLRAIVIMLSRYGVPIPPEVPRDLDNATEKWDSLKRTSFMVKEEHQSLQAKEAIALKSRGKAFEVKVADFCAAFEKTMPYGFSDNYNQAYLTIDGLHHGRIETTNVVSLVQDAERLNILQDSFELEVVRYTEVARMAKEATLIKSMWDAISLIIITYSEWKVMKWVACDVPIMMEALSSLEWTLEQLSPETHAWSGFQHAREMIDQSKIALPLVAELQNPSMRSRHWKQLMRITGVSFLVDEKFLVGDLLSLQLHHFEDEVRDIVDRAEKEVLIEVRLEQLERTWDVQVLHFDKSGDYMLLEVGSELVQMLDDNIIQMQTLQGSKYVQLNSVFLDQVTKWQNKLGLVDSTLNSLVELQTKWGNLHTIFSSPSAIHEQLAEEAARFAQTETEWTALMAETAQDPHVLTMSTQPGQLQRIEGMIYALDQCEMALTDHLEQKRRACPRFFFVSAADMLDILSKGERPTQITRHLKSCFDAVAMIEFKPEEGEGVEPRIALGMHSPEGEYVDFHAEFECRGDVETWFGGLVRHTHKSVEKIIVAALKGVKDGSRTEFISKWPQQAVTMALQVVFTSEIGSCFDAMTEGYEHAMRDYGEKIQSGLDRLVESLAQKMEVNMRSKVSAVVILEVHGRDLVDAMIVERLDNADVFQWQSQLRFSLVPVDGAGRATAKMCDFSMDYGCEYVGSGKSLVITPLTDRCFITLTQALKMSLGGALIGNPGVGKTETVKGLGRTLGVMVYAFNCSDQIDHASIHEVLLGLASAGAWGCFDEFNRVNVSVLSFVSSYLKTILDGIRGGSETIVHNGDTLEISMDPCMGAFLTMNPDNGARSSLPESTRSLFRPCAMSVPDVGMIAEIMLQSGGYSLSKTLSKKIVTLFDLCGQLLSRQHHYDWSLRSTRAVISAACEVRQDELEDGAKQGEGEEEALYYILQAYSSGMIADVDRKVFDGLLADLFPKAASEHDYGMTYAEAESHVQAAASLIGLQTPRTFGEKVVQLRDALSLRCAAFVLGPAGCGKSECIKTLCRFNNDAKERTTSLAMNPKSVSRNELFGYYDSDMQWKDGMFSHVFREMATSTSWAHQYLVLDGDVDALWAESINSVMDDNKALTLASNERIPMMPSMRILFESSSLEHVSPATVSRGGVVYMSSSDVSWRNLVLSWLQTIETEAEKQALLSLIDKYVPPLVEFCHRQGRHIVPLSDINLVQTMCNILDAMLSTSDSGGTVQSLKNGNEVFMRSLEGKVMYSCVWGIGGALVNEKKFNCMDQFDRFWRETFNDISFPAGGNVFDHYWETQEKSGGGFVNWKTKVSYNSVIPNSNLHTLFVATSESLASSNLLSLLISQRHAVMFCGSAGTGKTSLVKDRLHALDPEMFSMREIHLNTCTDPRALQGAMKVGLEKRTGRIYGPPGAKKLVYFLDDVNMPEIDKYGTQKPLALLRQQLGYGYWYDHKKEIMCDVRNVQYVACANPTSGPGPMDPRFQRLFSTFAISMPHQDSMMHIFQSIVTAHFSNFDQAVQRLASEPLVRATLNLHNSVIQSFVPTATNFHYSFTMWDLSNIARGICRSLRPYYSTPAAIIRLWLHESERIYSDRLVTSSEREMFRKICNDITLKWFDEHCDVSKIMARPLLFTTFSATSTDSADRPYCAVTDISKLTRLIEDKLADYNETKPVMQLVMFEQAVEHVCRIARVLDFPYGSMLLVGVGGSGKQSLAMLASHICGHEHHAILVTPNYSYSDFLTLLKGIYFKAAFQGTGVVLTLTDVQMHNDMFLVAVNDFLCRGDVVDMFTEQEKVEIYQRVQSSVKSSGRLDTRENCWEFFLEEVRSKVHLCLCFSPVGDTFRTCAKRFPALVSCTTMNYFHAWPHEALVAVASTFLAPSGLSGENLDAVAQHMSFVQATVNQASAEYLEIERRYNYTTPKTFLDLIELYKSMLGKKRSDVFALQAQLTNGLSKMQYAAKEVVLLQARLEEEMLVVEKLSASANEVLDAVRAESELAEAEKDAASEDEAAFSRIAAEVAKYQSECEEEERAANPLLEEAEAAMKILDKKSVTELKSLQSPPAGVEDVTAAVMVLLAKGQVPKDLSFAAAKKSMANADNFIRSMTAFSHQHITEDQLSWCEKNCTSKDSFNPDKMRSKSVAAAGLCGWVGNMCKYRRLLQQLEPKKKLWEAAKAKEAEANEQLSGVRGKIKEIEDRLSVLTEHFQAATKKKADAQARADKTSVRAETARRLVEGLQAEKQRWEASLAIQDVQQSALVGDALLASSFVSYIGAFNARLRSWLLYDNWVPDMLERRIPMTYGIDPMDILTNPAQLAGWCDEGLPSDEISLQNGAILDASLRWPLLIDPQMQGVKWAVSHWERRGGSVVVVKMDDDGYLTHIEQAMVSGVTVMIQNMGEEIDAMLQPILSRSVSRRGTSSMIRVGGRDIEFDPNFRLLLHTKLSNPHYPPEVSAQTTIVNFVITREGLTEQLLRLLLAAERPDLGQEVEKLVSEQQSLTIQLKEVEDAILTTLSSAEGDILADADLIEGLGKTKETGIELQERKNEMQTAEATLSAAQGAYRTVAERAGLLWVLIDSLWHLSHNYRFTVSHFIAAFQAGLASVDETKAMLESDSKQLRLERLPSEDGIPADSRAGAADASLSERVQDLKESTILSCFLSAADGLVEAHKLVLAAELCLSSLIEKGKLDSALYNALVNVSRPVASQNPLREWLSDDGWGAVLQLEDIEVGQADLAEEGEEVADGPDIRGEPGQEGSSSNPFDGLASDMVEASKLFRWVLLVNWCSVCARAMHDNALHLL